MTGVLLKTLINFTKEKKKVKVRHFFGVKEPGALLVLLGKVRSFLYGKVACRTGIHTRNLCCPMPDPNRLNY